MASKGVRKKEQQRYVWLVHLTLFYHLDRMNPLPIDPAHTRAVPWMGFGTSLAWWANVVGMICWGGEV